MSHSIQIENFKAFQKTGEIILAPITVLCGPNSAGKSSIIQALLLIRQSMLETQSSVRSPDERQPLILNGQLTRLGSWSNVIHGKKIDETLTISISTKGQVTDWYAHRREHNPRLYIRRGVRDQYDVSWSLSVRSSQSEQVEVSQYINQISIDRKDLLKITFTKEATTDPTSGYEATISNFPALIRSNMGTVFNLAGSSPAKRFTEAIAKIQTLELTTGSLVPNFQGALLGSLDVTAWGTWRSCLSELIARVRRSRRGTRGPEPRYVAVMASELDKLGNETDLAGAPDRNSSARNLRMFIRTLTEMIRSHINNNMPYVSSVWEWIRYVGPLRDEPRRYYEFDDVGGIEIGKKGEFTTQVLVIETGRRVRHTTIDSSPGETLQFRDPRYVNLPAAVNEWLRWMGLPEVSATRVHPAMSMYSMEATDHSLRLPLPDVGFGASQVIPIVTECLRAIPGDLVILEQPEIHLHPRIQSLLADFLIARIKDGISFLVESHSEYFVKRLCRRMAENPDLQTSVNILFVERYATEESVIRPIRVNPFGEILQWPIGFFDAPDDAAWLKASLARRKGSRTGT